MNHWVIVPIVLPLCTGIALLFVGRGNRPLQRTLGLGAALALLGVDLALLGSAREGVVHVYALGNWMPPFGITLVLDRLSSLMLLLTAVLAVFSLMYSAGGTDSRGRSYHALFQFQLMGLNGAFLTGDLFNLFVFFEVLLIASYGLLLHGAGHSRLGPGLHYVVYNVVGSSLFLLAAALLYAALGTLNLADMAVKAASAAPAAAGLIRIGALLLLVVFAVKAALLPLHFWLPDAYANATAPVAAQFSIMTKVGVYAILRVYTLVFGAGAGPAADIAAPWLLPLALATVAVGTLGALASRDLGRLVAFLVIASVGIMLSAVGLFTAAGINAALYYMAHSTLIVAALFLLTDVIAVQRGASRGLLDNTPPVAQPALLGTLFLVASISVAGVPPLSGFIGKVMVLQAAGGGERVWVWTLVLASSLLVIIALSRAGSTLFWKTKAPGPEWRPSRATAVTLVPAAALLAAGAALVLLAGPVTDFTAATAAQLLEPQGYIHAVLGPRAPIYPQP
ncbi:MAG: monovalent cation/H+ antiporter subunit D [Gammaproteobacteria bacterium]